MRFRKGIAAMAFVFMAVAALQAQSQTQFFPLSEIRPGLKGVGRTVFEGNKVQEFQVEILGVLKNFLAPKHDVILARLSGGPLAQTGVVEGMSGSPVYVDGKLLGAVALAFPFAKEPIAGITPIQDMLDVVPEGGPPVRAGRARPMAASSAFKILGTSADPSGSARLIPEEPAGEFGIQSLMGAFPSEGGKGTLSDLLLPLRFGGFSTQAMETYSPLFRQLGFQPMQGAALSGAENMPASPEGPQPGSMVSMVLVRGDFNLNADCTVTYRKGNDLYACGHRFLMVGPASIPFAESHVLATVPSIASSFKVDAPGPLVGTIRQDRFGAVFGVLGEKAPMIPVTIHLDSTLNRKTDYQFDMIQQAFLSPVLLNLGVMTTLSGTERSLGPSTLELSGQIHLSDGESVRIEDIVSGEINTAGVAGAIISTPLNYLMSAGFPGLGIKGIDLTIVSTDEKRAATLEQVWSTKSQVRPGDRIVVTALLRTPSGETLIQKIPVDIPESVNDKRLSLVVGSGSALNALQNRLVPLSQAPRNLQQLVRALNRMRRDNRLYALLMAPQRSLTLQGDEYPSPPPSLVQTFLADPSVSSSVIFGTASVIGDFETKPALYTIEGRKILYLTVEDSGS
ncbi:MAG TPA: SpoIVB peptidase S55 domain-containing protein [Terriglobia bacterium]|nr:SpoIVB peptidase S55 domain-containing protein [Terriglobia bacterium]